MAKRKSVTKVALNTYPGMGAVLKLGELMLSVTFLSVVVNCAHCYEKMIILQLVYRKHEENTFR